MKKFKDEYLKQDLEDFIQTASKILQDEYDDMKYNELYMQFYSSFMTSKWKNSKALISRLEKEFEPEIESL